MVKPQTKAKAGVGGLGGLGVAIAIAAHMLSHASALFETVGAYADHVHLPASTLELSANAGVTKSLWSGAKSSLAALSNRLGESDESAGQSAVEDALCSVLENWTATGGQTTGDDLKLALVKSGLKSAGLTSPPVELNEIASGAAEAQQNGTLPYYGFVTGFCELSRGT